MRRRLGTLLLVVLLPVLLLVGIYLGAHPRNLPGFVRDPLVGSSNAQVYDEAIRMLQHDYYRPLDRGQLVDKSLGAAVKSLNDRFSNYFSPKDYSSFQEATQGQFEGVGMSVEKDPHGLKVITVYAGSPAAKGGLKPGDVITQVNGQSIAGASSEASTAKIKGPAGTPVTLTVNGGKASRKVTLKRAAVDIPVVQSKMVKAPNGDKVADVRLAGFTSGAHGEVSQAVHKLLGQGAKGVVLDLRDNGGGLLNEAVLISSVFVPDGRIVSTRGRARAEQVYDATGGAISTKIPVVVLVNRQSASASEIVTGALQDRKRATVVGTRTFGKGVFQEIEQLSNGGALDITVGQYFLPSGRNIGGVGVSQGGGITPDVKAVDNPKTAPDEALRTAVKTVASKRA